MTPAQTPASRPAARAGGTGPAHRLVTEEDAMTERTKGKMEKIKGDLKQRIGGATKDRDLQAEGWAEEKKGQLREGVEDLKDAVKRDEPGHDRP